MSRTHFSWLLAATIAVAVLVLFMPGKTGRDNGIERQLLLPELAKGVNEVDYVRITGAANQAMVTLQREGDRWVALDASSYPAKWETLRALLSDLSQAEILEVKTANPEFYPRLGVEDLSLEDATGVMVDFGDDSLIPALIIGNRAQGRQGRYVRLRDADASALIDRELEIPLDAVSWLDREIVDIPDANVVEVEISHADGEHIVASKVSADDTDFVLQDIPQGREIQSSWTVNSLGGSLAGLSFDAAAPESSIDWAGSSSLRMLGADGMQVVVDLVAQEELRWIRLQAAVAGEGTVANETRERVEVINQRVGGWAYQIPLYKFDTMNKRMADLLKAEEKADENAADAP